jgi:hypothetical protein
MKGDKQTDKTKNIYILIPLCSFPAFTKKKNSENTWPNETNVSYYCHWICPFQKYTEGKKKRRVNILDDLILFIRMFFSILIYKDKNTNLINKFLKFH